jgi:hypothetical protein
MMTGFRHGLIGGLKRTVPLLECVRCVIRELLPPLHPLQEEGSTRTDQGSCGQNAFHLYI